jgi:hypothetical protein
MFIVEIRLNPVHPTWTEALSNRSALAVFETEIAVD